MAWSSSNAPSSGGVWLECNGQSIPSQYKRLRELVGDKTPNYQGVFLRGAGSQTVSAVQNAIETKNQTFSSGSLGEIQTDAMRPIRYNTNRMLIWDDRRKGLVQSNPVPVPGAANRWLGVAYTSTSRAVASLMATATWFDEDIWALKQAPKKYHLESSGGGTDNEGNALPVTYTLVEEEDTESGRTVNIWGSDWAGWSDMAVPIDDETRPINIAVKYFIKAR